MNRPGSDPKVKKTLVRNCEQKTVIRQKDNIQTAEATTSNTRLKNKKGTRKSNLKEDPVLNHPTMCSSDVFAHYLTDATKNLPMPLRVQDQNIDKDKISSKMTKKLNFHFNDKMYKNLVELNSQAEIQKGKKERRTIKTSAKKDLEPNIEDFCDDDKEKDIIPQIPIHISKFKPIKKVETGHLHELVSFFEKS